MCYFSAGSFFPLTYEDQIFVIEYELEPEDLYFQAKELGFNGLKKNWELNEYRVDCNEF